MGSVMVWPKVIPLSGVHCTFKLTYLDAKTKRERHGHNDEKNRQSSQDESGEPWTLGLI